MGISRQKAVDSADPENYSLPSFSRYEEIIYV